MTRMIARQHDWIGWLIFIGWLAMCGCQGDSYNRSGQLKEADSPVNKRNELLGDSDVSTVPAVEVDSHQWMIDRLNEIVARVPDENGFFGNRVYRELQQQIAEQEEGPETIGMLVRLGRRTLILGREEEAVVFLSRALELLDGSYRDVAEQSGQETRSMIAFWLGVAWLRRAETLNCCQRNTPESCVLPIRGTGIHEDPEAAMSAITFLQQSHDSAPERSRLRMQSRWLLNLAYMTIGEYPDAVPENMLIDPMFFESQVDELQFRNIAKQLKIDTFGCAGGAIMDDFDNDGDLDLFVSDYDPAGQLRYFRNDREAGFVDCTKEAGLIGLTGGLNLNQADFNNDGWTDVYVMRGGWFGKAGEHPNSLLKNMRDGTFQDVTFRSGLANKSYPSQTAGWADFDRDGDLDLLVGNEPSARANASQLFRNNGNETFTDVTRESGIDNRAINKGVTWGDFNDDGWPDCYFSNADGKNQLYENRRNGTFANVARFLKVERPLVSFPCWFWDFDNDGRLDLFVGSYETRISDFAAWVNTGVVTSELPCVYRNTGRGFEDVTKSVKLNVPTAPMGSNFGDINNDGYLDMYLGTGWPEFEELMPNMLFSGSKDAKFQNRTMGSRLGHLQKGHGVVFADFDHDGDQDLFVEMGGAFPGDRYFNALFENPGNENRWIVLKLTGVKTNRSAIGARIQIDIEDAEGPRTIYRHVNSGGSFGSNPLRQHIGIGQADQIQRISIKWPGDVPDQEFYDIPANQYLEIIEGDDNPKSQEYPLINFDGQ